MNRPSVSVLGNTIAVLLLTGSATRAQTVQDLDNDVGYLIYRQMQADQAAQQSKTQAQRATNYAPAAVQISPAPQPQLPLTGNDLNDLLRRNDALAQSMAVGLLDGVVLATRQCAFPEKNKLSDIRDAVLGYLAAHPDSKSDKNPAKVIETAVNEAWPCKMANEADRKEQ